MELKVEVYKTEEEQVQAIKQWWKENYFSIIAGIVIGIAVLSGYNYWIKNKESQTQQASVIYSQILSSSNDKADNTEILKSDFSNTPYAALASLLLAKDYVNGDDGDKAVNELKWVVENNNDDAIQHVAQQRLARVYLSQDKIEAAETLLRGVKASGFSSAYNEIRGDINLAKKLPAQAKENYRIALSALAQGDKRFELVKMKLDDLTQASKVK